MYPEPPPSEGEEASQIRAHVAQQGPDGGGGHGKVRAVTLAEPCYCL